MSKKKEKAVQFFLPIGGSLVNQCCYVSEDELAKSAVEFPPTFLTVEDIPPTGPGMR